MWRRTEVYETGLVNNRTGYAVLRPSRFNQYRDDHGPDLPGGLPQSCDGVDRVWEPWVLSISGMFRDVTNVLLPPPLDAGITSNTAVEMLAAFVDYRVWEEQGRPDPSVAAGVPPTDTTGQLARALAFRRAVVQQQIAGFRAGDPGRRQFYASNATSDGYMFPRSSPPSQNDCADKVQGWWPLIITWTVPLIDNGLAFNGAFIVDWEWRAREV